MESPDHKTLKPGLLNRRPSLLRPGADRTADDGFSNSMLAALERDSIGSGPTSAVAARSRGKLLRAVLAVGVVGVVIASAAALVGPDDALDSHVSIAPNSRTQDLPAIAPQAPATDASVAAQTPDGAETASPEAAPAPPAWTPSSTARIEPAPVVANAPSASRMLADAAVASPPSSTPNPGSAALLLPSAEPLPARSRGKPVTPESAERAHRAAIAIAKAAARVDSHAVSGPKVRQGDNDADTDLVAALIARLDRRGAVPIAPAPSPGRAHQEDGATPPVSRCAHARRKPMRSKRVAALTGSAKSTEARPMPAPFRHGPSVCATRQPASASRNDAGSPRASRHLTKRPWP